MKPCGRIICNRWQKAALISLFLVLAFAVFKLQQLLFGPGPTHRGGRVGRWIDNTVRKAAFELAMKRHEETFEQCMGYPLPPLAEVGANQVGVQVILNAWFAHILMRTKRRHEYIQKYLNYNDDKTIARNTCIPRHIIQPDAGDWFRPINFNDNNPFQAKTNFTVLNFDENHMSNFMMEHYDQVYTTVYTKMMLSDQIQLFGIAAISVLGGLFLSANIRNWETLSKATSGMQDWIGQQTGNCNVDTATIWFQYDTFYNRIVALSAMPNHPKLKCALNEFGLSGGVGGITSLITMIVEMNWDTSCKNECCPMKVASKGLVEPLSTFIVVNSSKIEKLDIPIDTPRFIVTITERDTNRSTSLERKNRCGDRLRIQRCSSGWLCNRCLHTSFAGKFSRCQMYCRRCYKEIVCTAPQRSIIDIDIRVVERRNDTRKRIPRIIHQTYFEQLTTPRYPHLQRLQNSWKMSGWDYRFYSDRECLNFIQHNYPKRFAEAYESILPGAFKADFFRLLVLFKEGGIYSDVDVQLETDLDSFITKEMSFFIPRDVPLDYWPNSNYCLWNGLMGSAPGHPILGKAIEDVLINIQNRHDYHDIEGKLCSQNPDFDVWKLRTLPILILTGPCALGMSVNSAIGRIDALAGFDLGWLQSQNWTDDRVQPIDYFWGDAMTLLTDRYDLGELRFTDIDRNLIVASTNQDQLAKSPINMGNIAVSKEATHYSKSETDIVGESRVYKDDMVSNENVRLMIQHVYVSK